MATIGLAWTLGIGAIAMVSVVQGGAGADGLAVGFCDAVRYVFCLLGRLDPTAPAGPPCTFC